MKKKFERVFTLLLASTSRGFHGWMRRTLLLNLPEKKAMTAAEKPL